MRDKATLLQMLGFLRHIQSVLGRSGNHERAPISGEVELGDATL